MFSKNIKKLSLFLVLAVVMIVAVGAVSAADVPADDGASTADITGTTNNAISQDTASTGATGTISGVITTNSTSANGNVSKGATVNSSTTNPVGNLTLKSNGIYSTSNGTDAKGVSSLVNGVTISNGEITVNDNGSFSQKLTLTNANLLKDGQTYYVNMSFSTGTDPSVTEAYAFSSNGSYFTNISNTEFFVPFKYTGNTLTLDDDVISIVAGDSWTFTGILTDANNKPISGQLVTLNVTNGETEYGVASVTTGDDGKFSISSILYNTKNPTLPLNANLTNNYTFTFVTTVTANVTGTLNVSQKTGKINAVINSTNASYGEPLNITATIVDANGKIINDTITVNGTLFNKVTGAKLADVTFTKNDKGLYTTDDDFAGLDAGIYQITLKAYDNDNYNINASTPIVFTINKVATSIINQSSNNLVTDLDGLNGNAFNFISNTTTGDLNVNGVWTAVLYKENGEVLGNLTANPYGKTLTFTGVNNLITNNGKYYITITFTPADKEGTSDPTANENYIPSTTTVNITVKSKSELTDNITGDLDYTFGTTGNATNILLTLTPKLNTTVTVYNGNVSIGTVKLINGTANYSFGELALNAGEYKFTFVYAGDDTYQKATNTLTVNVAPVDMNTTITASPDTIQDFTINTINSTITLNLTNSTNASQIIDYTGDVNYTVTSADGKTVTKGTIAMTNGKATFNVNTLKGLTAGRNTVVFQISKNYASQPDTVSIFTIFVNSEIIAKNISTTNNTPITITGTVLNATEGTVTVYLYDSSKYDPENPGDNYIASATGKLNTDGTFAISFGTIANGNYTALINYVSGTGLSSDSQSEINVTVKGTSPEPTPVTGNITTVITVDNFTEYYGQALNLTGKLTDINGTPIIGQQVAINLTRLSDGASKIYYRNTDVNGQYQIPIELFAGNYSVSVSFAGYTTKDNATTYLPSGPASENFTVTAAPEPVDNRTTTVLSFSNFAEKYGQALNFTGTLKTTDGTPIVGQKLNMVLSNAAGQSKLYWRTTDTNGEVQLPIELFAGDYTFKCFFEGDSTYQPSNNQTGSITVTA